MSDTKNQAELGLSAVDFINKVAKVNDKGLWTVPQKDYTKFMEENRGISETVLKEVANANQEWVMGAYRFAGDKLLEKIEDAKKSGRDAKSESVEISTNIPFGQIKFGVEASRVYGVMNSDKTTTKTMVGRLVFQQKRMISKAVCEDYEDRVKKALGL